MIEQLRQSLHNIIQQEQGPIDTMALYPGSVAVQHDDGTVDVVLDDNRYGPGLSGIPVRSGVAGVVTRLPQGTRVAVGFEQQQRDKPAVMMWESGLPSQIIINTTSGKIVVEDGEGGSKVALQTKAGSIEIEDSNSDDKAPRITLSTTNVVVEAAGDATLKATKATVDAESIELGKGAALGVARLGDSVIAGPFGGVITVASSTVKAK